MTITAIPADKPAEILARIARRFRLRYTHAYLADALGRHEDPTSLVALVEVARTMGLRVTAGEADLEAFDDAEELPLVVHFESPGGFAILEGVSPAGFEVSDGQHGRRTLPREVFARRWSGVVVLVDPPDKPTHEPRYLSRRLREIVWQPMVGWAGLASLVLALVFMTIGQQASPLRMAALAMIAAVGTGLSLVMTTWTAGPRGQPLPLCGSRVGCTSVLLSRYATIGGVHFSTIGVAAFGSSLLILASASVAPGAVAPVWMVAALHVAALPVSSLLILRQIQLKSFCTLCMIVHSIVLLGSLAFVAVAEPPDALQILPWAGLQLLFFLILLRLVLLIFRRGRDLEGLASPFVSLARILATPRLHADGVGVSLGAGGPNQLLVIVHPSCIHCGIALAEVEELAADHSILVAVAPSDPRDLRDQAICAILTGIGLARGGATFVKAFQLVKQDMSLHRTEAGLRNLMAGLGIAEDELDLDAAHEQVQRASHLRTTVGGVPAMFLNGRNFSGPFDHLKTLCQLPDVLALTRDGA